MDPYPEVISTKFRKPSGSQCTFTDGVFDFREIVFAFPICPSHETCLLLKSLRNKFVRGNCPIKYILARGKRHDSNAKLTLGQTVGNRRRTDEKTDGVLVDAKSASKCEANIIKSCPALFLTAPTFTDRSQNALGDRFYHLFVGHFFISRHVKTLQDCPDWDSIT